MALWTLPLPTPTLTIYLCCWVTAPAISARSASHPLGCPPRGLPPHFDGNVPDLVVANGSSGNVSVLLNECGQATDTPTPTNTPTNTSTNTPTITLTPTITPTPTCSSQAVVGSWTIAAPYPTAVGYNAVTSDGTYVYSIGGSGSNGPTNIVRRYNPADNTWASLANLPGDITQAGAAYAAINNKIYVFGGANGSFQNTVFIYDIASNSWTTGANMPTTSIDVGAVYYSGNQRIYIIGAGPSQDQTWEYNPVTNTWSTGRAPRTILREWERDLHSRAIHIRHGRLS